MRGNHEASKNADWMTVIRTILMVFIVAICMLFPAAGNGSKMLSFGEQALGAEAASGDGLVWKNKKGYYYCYKNGQRLKGLQNVGGKTWYFDSKGRQKTGWRMIGDKYYYFTIENGEKGCLVTGKKVNGVRLGKSGAAVVTSSIKTKLSLLVRYQELVDKLVKPAEEKEAKLKTLFLYARKSGRVPTPDPGYSGRWDEKMAASFIESQCRGDCLGKAAAFAYLANALGYKKVTIYKNGHAFVTFGKRIYEVSLSAEDHMDYFGRKYSDKIVSWHVAQIRKNMPNRVI